MTAPTVDQPATAPTQGPVHTGGMTALVPAPEYLPQLAVDGGLLPDELHLTLVYLGDDVTDRTDEWRHEILTAAQLCAGQTPPIDARVFGHALFNPDGHDERYPVSAYLVGDTDQLTPLRDQLACLAHDIKQHAPFIPHITAISGSSAVPLSYTGPVVFDRLRVTLAGDVTDFFLGGNVEQGITVIDDATSVDVTAAASPLQELDDTQREAITAAVTAMVDKYGPVGAYATAPLVFPTPELLTVADSVIELPTDDDVITASAEVELPTVDMFTPPADMAPGTGHYVDGRRVYGRLAEWNVPHIGIDGRKVYPPRSRSGYRWFHTKTARVQGENGPERIKIGHLTFGTGHAGLGLGHVAAASHYDNSGFRGAKVRMSEDEHGIVYAGALVAGIEGAKLEEFEESDTSGDWRMIMGNLELVAALCVNIGGYPKVGLSLAASGEPYALVASARSWGQQVTIDYDHLADTIADRVIERQAITAALTTKQVGLLAELDDSEEITAALLTDLYSGEDEALMAAISAMPAQLRESYLHGKAATKIGWGTPGDFSRCVAEARHHGIPARMRDGMCATLHKQATGQVPGKH